MKKGDVVSVEDRRLAEARAQQRQEERLRKQERRAARTAPEQAVPRRRGRAGEAGLPQWTDVPVPETLDLIGHRPATCDFFGDVRRRVDRGQRVRLVFLATERISSEALIYLLAQVQKLRLIHGAECITGTYPESARIERLLADSGFFGVLRVRKRKMKGRPASATRFVTCKTDRMINGKSIPELREELLGDDLKMPRPIGRMVYRALTEAMANVEHHAYVTKSLRHQTLRGRWWLGGQLSRRKNFFELTFYDAGVGIPKTLHRKYTWEVIRGALSLVPGIQPDDAEMIKAAVELGRSRTKQENRGKGLLDIHRLITEVGAGALTIFSRTGYYRYEPGRELVTNDGNFVEGTLIKWELPLDKVVAFANLDQDHDDADA